MTNQHFSISGKRRVFDRLMTGLVIAALVLAVTPLVWILYETTLLGAPAINLSFLTNLPTPENVPNGGIANAILGTFTMVGIAALIAVPIGIGAGVFFSEWPESRLSIIGSFMNDVLTGFPSIVIGIFVYIIVVLPTRSFSAVAGAVALSIIMLPIIARTTQESLKIVPMTLREASTALGVSKWRTVISVVMSTGKSGLLTGIILAVQRAAGETAPLLLTALGSYYFATSLWQPTAALPLLIFTYATSPSQLWHQEAWGAALILVLLMLMLNLSVRLLIGRKQGVRAEI